MQLQNSHQLVEICPGPTRLRSWLMISTKMNTCSWENWRRMSNIQSMRIERESEISTSLPQIGSKSQLAAET